MLENHHLFRAFTTLQSEGCNFLRDMSYAQIQRFRHIVIELVLSTDFAFHLKLVNQFKMLVSGMPDKAALTSADDKLLMWRIIMKTADLGHCCKPFTLHRRWAYRVMEEMYRQVCVFSVLSCLHSK